MRAADPLQPVLSSLTRSSGAVSARASSWDRTGGNQDWITVGAGETATLLEVDGPGCVTRLYFTMVLYRLTDLRDAILRCWWDGEEQPSVEVPFGEFFGLAHGRVRRLSTFLTDVNPGYGPTHGFVAHFPMPFADGARVTIENRADTPLGGRLGALWFHVDYERHDAPPPGEVLRFHARYRQERPTTPASEPANTLANNEPNLSAAENYTALEASGRGHMVGLVLGVDNLAGGWWGEGDDMVFIDGSDWPPAMHGTGTEEIFGGGACPDHEYAGLYHGFPLIESPTFEGLTGMYRWYVHDPIRFRRSIRWTIEHGHANNMGIDYHSVAFWYQTEPHAPFPALPDRDDMRPPGLDGPEATRLATFVDDLSTMMFAGQLAAAAGRRPDDLTPEQEQLRDRLAALGRAPVFTALAPYYEGRWAQAGAALSELGFDVAP